MINTENFIKELYWFLQENQYIDRTAKAYRKETLVFNKLEEIHNNGSLSHNDCKDLNQLFTDAICEHEISGFISGIYFSKIIYMML